MFYDIMSTDGKLLFSDKVVIARLGISRRTFYRYLEDGTLESPFGRLAKNRRGWTDNDIVMAESKIRRPMEDEGVTA